jgi:hypothetical protein
MHRDLARQLRALALDPARPPGVEQWRALLVELDKTFQLQPQQDLDCVARLAAQVAHDINTPLQFLGDNIAYLEAAAADLLRLCQLYGTMCERAAARALDPGEQAQLRLAEQDADLTFIREDVPRAAASTGEGLRRLAATVRGLQELARPPSELASARLDADRPAEGAL